jgi:hypothetical protein
MATRIALGVSASVYLATRNKIHADSDAEGGPGPENAPDPAKSPPLGAGFTADKSLWYLRIRDLSESIPDGILRGFWFARFGKSFYNSTDAL